MEKSISLAGLRRYEAVYERDRKMTEFLDSAKGNMRTEEDNKGLLKNTIVALLKHISKTVVSSEVNVLTCSSAYIIYAIVWSSCTFDLPTNFKDRLYLPLCCLAIDCLSSPLPPSF